MLLPPQPSKSRRRWFRASRVWRRRVPMNWIQVLCIWVIACGAPVWAYYREGGCERGWIAVGIVLAIELLSWVLVEWEDRRRERVGSRRRR